MELMWYCVGILAGFSVYLLFRLSKVYQLDRIAWPGLILGIFLLLFTIAWSTGSILEGVPRAAAMGVVFFGLPGVLLLIFSARWIARHGRQEVPHPAEEGDS